MIFIICLLYQFFFFLYNPFFCYSCYNFYLNEYIN